MNTGALIQAARAIKIHGSLSGSESEWSERTPRSGALARVRPAAEDICLTCGLCCNGVIFADVRLQPGDEPDQLRALGLPLKFSRREGEVGSRGAHEAAGPVQRLKFPQPCTCFDGRGCRIYAERPRHCRQFECGVLKSLKAGEIPRSSARRLIRSARAKADQVQRRLRQLGDTEEDLPLAKRYRRTSRRLEQSGQKPALAHSYGQLTLAAHDLNLLLSEAFYPGHNAHRV